MNAVRLLALHSSTLLWVTIRWLSGLGNLVMVVSLAVLKSCIVMGGLSPLS
jgi:hypothetical protein